MFFKEKYKQIGILTPMNDLPFDESINHIQWQDTPLLCSFNAFNLTYWLPHMRPSVLSIKSPFIDGCFIDVHKLLICPVCKLYKPFKLKKF